MRLEKVAGWAPELGLEREGAFRVCKYVHIIWRDTKITWHQGYVIDGVISYPALSSPDSVGCLRIEVRVEDSSLAAEKKSGVTENRERGKMKAKGV